MKILMNALFVSAAVLAFLSACGKSKVRTDADGLPLVQTESFKRESIPDEIQSFGSVSFVEKIAVTSKVEGRVQRLYKRVGDRVYAGEVIAEMERLPLEIEERKMGAELIQAEAGIRLSEVKYEEAGRRVENTLLSIEKADDQVEAKTLALANQRRVLSNQIILLAEGGATPDRVETLRTEVRQLEIELAAALKDREMVRRGFRDEDILASGLAVPANPRDKKAVFRKINTRIEEAELEAARASVKSVKLRQESVLILLKECSIVAPRAGVVGQRNFEEGEEVTKSSPMFVLFDTGKVHIVASVNEKDFSKIRRGLSAKIEVDASDKKLIGQVDIISPLFDIQTRSGEVRILAWNPGELLKPGMFARVVISTGLDTKAWLLPTSAIQNRDKDQNVVFVVKDGTAFEKAVKVGREHDGKTRVLEGLADDDLVVTEGMEGLRDNVKVHTTPPDLKNASRQ